MTKGTRRLAPGALALGLSVLAAACGDDHHHGDSCGLEANCTSDLESYSDGLTVAAESGDLQLRVVTANPAPPNAEGMNTWTVEVLDGSGARLDDSELTRFNTWSIDCMHFGTEGEGGLDLSGVSNGDGTHTIEFFYVHGGPWNVEIDATAGGSDASFVVGLCLEETGAHEHEG